MKKTLALLLAVIMVASLFAGCAKSGSDDVVTLKWVAVGSGMPANYDAWAKNLNAYLEEKIGVHLEMEIIGWSDWDARRNLIVSTNEPYDIMFTNNGTFNSDVAMGAFADLSDIVDSAAPELVKFIPTDYWDACKVGGKLYGVPTYKDSSSTQYFVYDKEVVEGTGLDYASAHTMQDVTAILAAMYANTGTSPMVMHSGGMDAIYGSKYDDLSSGLPAIGVSYTGGEAKVVSVFEQEDIMTELETLHEWYEAGYINSDAATLSEAPTYRAAFVAQGWPYAAVSTWGPQIGVEAVAIQYGNTVLSNSTVQGSMNCISASCKYPEKALQLLELVNTDVKVRDALYYGLEGDNYEYVDGGKVNRLNTDWTMAGYTQGTFFTVSQLVDDDYNQWDEVKELNSQAIGSPVLGFSFDTTNVKDELSACIAVFTKYRSVLMTGTNEPHACVQEMLAEMYDAGLQKVIDEAQAQIDAWKA